jgi:uncharacterized protein YkwD
MRRIWAGWPLLPALILCGAWSATSPQPERLTLSQSRDLLAALINADRAAKGLSPVALDPVATAAGQKHAEEMAVHQYMSHWNFEGKLPDQRYTEQGGRDHVRENVYLTRRGPPGGPDEPLALDPNPTFTRREIEEIEAAYFNQFPPNDFHRRNILEPSHTHVGIALARASLGERAEAIANTEEFVARYLEVDPIPLEAAPGARITVSGKTLPGVSLRSIEIARSDAPQPLSPANVEQTHNYSLPEMFASYRPDEESAERRIRLLPDGSFIGSVALAGMGGLYYVRIKAQVHGSVIVASQRTVLVVKP